MPDTSIMLVEDEIIVAADVKNRLENMGYEVLGIFDTGEEAIEKAGELKPNLVLMDIVLKEKWMELMLPKDKGAF